MTFKTGSWGSQAKERSKRRNEYFRLYRKRRDPKKLRARAVVNYLLQRKVIQRKTCKICGEGGRTEAHHKNYDKPLSIVWLCPKHHREEDRKLSLR